MTEIGTSEYDDLEDSRDPDFGTDIPRLVECVMLQDDPDKNVDTFTKGPMWKNIAVGITVFGCIAVVGIVIVVVVRTVFHKSSSEPQITWEDLDGKVI